MAFNDASMQGSYRALLGHLDLRLCSSNKSFRAQHLLKTTEIPVSVLLLHLNKENSRGLQEDDTEKVIAGTQIIVLTEFTYLKAKPQQLLQILLQLQNNLQISNISENSSNFLFPLYLTLSWEEQP